MKVTRHVRVMDIRMTLGETCPLHTPFADTQLPKPFASKGKVYLDEVT